MTLQRTLLRKYLGLDFRRFDAITFDEISNSDRFILDRGAGLTLPALDELATIVDSVLVGDDQEEIITRVIQRMTSHVNGMMQRSLCPICQTLVENFTLQILVHLALYLQFKLAGWYENPIKSVVLTFPIEDIVFPTVTLCPEDCRPDRFFKKSSARYFCVLHSKERQELDKIFIFPS